MDSERRKTKNSCSKRSWPTGIFHDRSNEEGHDMLVYDCEIINAIKPKKPSEVRKDIKYCDGWEDYKGMGISCVGLYDTVKRKHYMACATPMLESLLKETGLQYELMGIKDIISLFGVLDVLVGFNNL
jgi:hypothetical protein